MAACVGGSLLVCVSMLHCFFSFAFITFNPCFTAWVYHGVFTVVFSFTCLHLHMYFPIYSLCGLFLVYDI